MVKKFDEMNEKKLDFSDDIYSSVYFEQDDIYFYASYGHDGFKFEMQDTDEEAGYDIEISLSDVEIKKLINFLLEKLPSETVKNFNL